MDEGGYLIPENFVINKPKKGVFWSIVRLMGRALIRISFAISRLGEKINHLGCYEETIHPRKSLIEIMEKMKIDSGK